MQTILLHYGGYWTRATGANQRYVKGKEVKLMVDPRIINFLDIVGQVPQVEGSNHAVTIAYRSPSSLSNPYVELEDNAGLVKMFHECRFESCIELYSVLEMVGTEDNMKDPPQECPEGSPLGNTCVAPFTAPGQVRKCRKRGRKSGSTEKFVKKAKKFEGSAKHMASVLNSVSQTLEAGFEILECAELWNLMDKLEGTLRQLRLRREKLNSSSSIEVEDDDYEDELIDSFVSGQKNVPPENSASPEDITEVTRHHHSDNEYEQTHHAVHMFRVPTSAVRSEVPCTGKKTVGVPIFHSGSLENNTIHQEASMELFSNLFIAENVPEKDKVSLNLQLSMLKAESKAIVMFLKCPFEEKAQIGLEGSLKLMRATLTPMFDKYFGIKAREQIEAVFNLVSRMQICQALDYISEAELIYAKNIEKFKDTLKYAEKELHMSLNIAKKACQKSRCSKERFRNVLLDLCMVAKRLDCALRSCMNKRERRRKVLLDYIRNVSIVERSRRELSLAEANHAIELSCISEKICEERKKKLLKEAEALLAGMTS